MVITTTVRIVTPPINTIHALAPPVVRNSNLSLRDDSAFVIRCSDFNAA